jgi:hypothetical protein
MLIIKKNPKNAKLLYLMLSVLFSMEQVLVKMSDNQSLSEMLFSLLLQLSLRLLAAEESLLQRRRC